MSIGETIATFAPSGNIPFTRLLLIACDSQTSSISEAAFTSLGGILSSPEDFLMSRDFSKNAAWDGFVYPGEDFAFDCASINLLLISIIISMDDYKNDM